MIEIVNFYKGSEKNYSYLKTPISEEHKNGLFFATDTKRLYLNGEIFGRGLNNVLDISIESSILTISFEDKTQKTLDLRDAISLASEEKQGLLSKEDKKYINDLPNFLESEFNTLTEYIQTLQSEVKSYSIECITENLESNIKEAYRLIDEDGNQSGKTIYVYKDSSLKAVELDGQILRFTYILNTGEEKQVEINISEFLAESEFKDGLSVENGIVKVKIDSESEEFISVSENGIKLFESKLGKIYYGSDSIDIDSNTNVISLKSANADLVQVEEIPVGGTPLADLLLAKDIKTINAGNLQTVLENLFSVDIPGTGSRSIPTSATLSMSVPSCSLTSGPVEVGYVVSLNAETKTASASATVSYTGFPYGWSAENDNTKDGDGTPTSKTYTAIQDNDTNYTLSATIDSGFTGETIADKTGSSKATISESLTTVLGTNKVTVTATAPTFTISIAGQPQYFICSSLEKTSNSVPASEASSINVASTTKTNSASVVAVYPVYTNAVSETVNNTTSTDKKVIVNSNVFEVTYGPETVAFDMFAYPATHTLSKVEIWNPNASSYGDYTGGSVTSSETKTLLSGDKSYSVWIRQGAASEASTKFKFTLNKKTSVE